MSHTAIAEKKLVSLYNQAIEIVKPMQQERWFSLAAMTAQPDHDFDSVILLCRTDYHLRSRADKQSMPFFFKTVLRFSQDRHSADDDQLIGMWMELFPAASDDTAVAPERIYPEPDAYTDFMMNKLTEPTVSSVHACNDEGECVLFDRVREVLHTRFAPHDLIWPHPSGIRARD